MDSDLPKEIAQVYQACQKVTRLEQELEQAREDFIKLLMENKK